MPKLGDLGFPRYMYLHMRSIAKRMAPWETIFFIGIAIASAQSVRSGQNVYRFPNAQVLATQQEVADYGYPLRRSGG